MSYDSWLENYRMFPTVAYCDNPKCGNHDGATVTYFSENGMGWYEPEFCESCNGEWLDDKPEEEDEDE